MKKRKQNHPSSARGIDIFVFIFPVLLLFCVFVMYPIIPEIITSFQKSDGFRNQGWVGFKNYVSVFTSKNFWLVHKNTYLVASSSLLVALPISMLFALLMDCTIPWVRNLFKFASVFPAVLSPTVIGRLWMAIYENDWGVINSALRAIGLGSLTRSWLGDEKVVMISIAVAFLWQYLGLNALLFYTGIKAIPKTYYEAAEIDGGGFWVNSFRITIPLLQDVVKYVVLTSTLGSLAMFSYVNVMTSGGPGYVSRTVPYEVYQLAFLQGKFGQGCALSVVFIFECIFIAILINHFIAREKIEY